MVDFENARLTALVGCFLYNVDTLAQSIFKHATLPYTRVRARLAHACASPTYWYVYCILHMVLRICRDGCEDEVFGSVYCCLLRYFNYN